MESVLKGKTCLVTGASSGLGLCTVKRFAGLGATVILVCRDRARGRRAAEEVASGIPGAELELAICDLASLGSARRFAGDFKASHRRLDVLFNNAAVWKMSHTITEDGVETMFQVNCLAPFLLMEALVEPLLNSPDPRIINIAAPGRRHRLDMTNTRDPKRFDPLASFFQTKLWLAILSAEFSRRHSGSIAVYLTEPGPGKFKSNLTREVPRWLRFAMDVFSKPADRPAGTIAYLATADDPDKGAGKVYFGKKARPMPPSWLDGEAVAGVWNAARDLLADIA